MQSFVRRALAASVAGVCLVGAGVFTVPAAVAAIQQMQLDSNAQSYVLSSSASKLATSDVTVGRDDFAVSHFTLIQYPVAVGTPISSYFGYRSCTGCSTFHSGIDFTPGDGTPIAAVADGTVVASTVADGSWGVHVTIETNVDGVIYRTSYAHMRTGSMTLSIGDTVTRGQVIGLVGNTGQSEGSHLHFSVQTEDNTFIDPLPWLKAHVNVDNL